MEEKKDLEKKIDSTPEKIAKLFLCPPFRYYLVITFVLTFFIVILDGIYRSDAFLVSQPFLSVIQNGIFLWVSLFSVFMLVSLFLWGGDALTVAVLKRKNQGNTSDKTVYANYLSSVLYYGIFAYINIIYFRLYLSSFVPGMRKNGVITGAVLLSSIAVVLAAILYFVKFKKFMREYIFRGLTTIIFRLVLILTVIIFITAYILFNFTGENRSAASGGTHILKGNKPHIILITLDNVRCNNMSLYGYKRKTTPFLENFARESTVFKNMSGVSTETMVGMPSIITGRYPVKEFPFPQSHFDNSLPEILMKNGYGKTIFLSPLSMNLFPRQKFSEYLILNNSKGDPMRAFSYMGKSRKVFLWLSAFLSEDDRFFNIFNHRDPRDITFSQTQTIMTEAYEYIIKSMKNSEKPIFIWAHFLETHPPFNPPPALKQYFKGSPDPELDKYDGCIRYSDYELGNFIGRLKIEGLYDNSLILISSDHGCYFPFEAKDMDAFIKATPPSAVLRFNNLVSDIPLIIHEPGQKKGGRVRGVAGHIDITPTILELAGINPPNDIDGKSLVKFMRDLNATDDRMRILIPAQYEYRWNEMSFEETEHADYEFFSVFYDHYAIEFGQREYIRIENEEKDRGRRKEKKIYTDELPFVCVGVYDLDNDKYRKNNIMDQPGSKELIDRVLKSEMMEYYGKINLQKLRNRK